MQETWVWTLWQEDPLEKEMATHSSFLSWKIPWTEELAGYSAGGRERVGHDWVANTHFGFHVSDMLYSFKLAFSKLIGLHPDDNIRCIIPMNVKLFS